MAGRFGVISIKICRPYCYHSNIVHVKRRVTIWSGRIVSVRGEPISEILTDFRDH